MFLMLKKKNITLHYTTIKIRYKYAILNYNIMRDWIDFNIKYN